VSDELELREVIAASRDLPSSAAMFLVGSNIQELEASADALAKLVGEHREEERREEPASGFFERAAAEKAARKRELVDLLSGRVYGGGRF
jgi:hypothetical protein